MKTKKFVSLFLVTIVLLVGCGENKTDTSNQDLVDDDNAKYILTESTLPEEKNSAKTESASGSEHTNFKETTASQSPEKNEVFVELSGSDNYQINKGGTYTLFGSLKGQVVVDTVENIVLRLAGVTIQSDSGPAINIQSAQNMAVEIVEGTRNYLSDVASDVDNLPSGALYSSTDMEIRGNGNLTVNGAYKHAIAANGNLTIDSGSYEIYAEKDGIRANGNLVVQGGDINIVKSKEGIESKSNLYINGGYIRLNAKDDGLNAGELIEINDGILKGLAGGDGIDSNGDLVINGGTVVVYATNSANAANGPLDVVGQFVVNGGTIFVSGGSMDIEVSGDSKQASLWVGANLKTGNPVEFLLKNKQEVLHRFEVGNDASLAFYSSKQLEINQSYEVRVVGQSIGSTLLRNYIGTIGNRRLAPGKW